MNSKAKWITNALFCDLIPNTNIFHKENISYKPDYNEKLLNSHILFRKKFTINDISKKYTIHISADDYYFLYINGQFVCSGPSPAYPWHYYYNDIEISKFLIDGENLIAVHTYYQGLINRVWVSGDDQHGLICQIYEDGKDILSSDTTFKCKMHSAYGIYDIGVKRHDTIFNEFFDSNADTIGFENIDFDDRDWEFCYERVNHNYTLFKQNTAPLEYYIIKPKIIKQGVDSVYVDIGKEIVGYINIKAKGVQNSIITIEYAEELDENSQPRFDMRCNCKYLDKWRLSGAVDKFTPFDYKGFRYAKINLPQNEHTEILDISIVVRHSPFDEKTVCNINDSDIQKIWRLCADTIKYGTQECFIDCPTREKGQYLGDVCISALSYSILTGNTEMLKKSIIDFSQSAKICKGLMAVSTSSFMQEIADYSLLFPFIVLWYHKLSGDTGLVRDLVPTILDLLEYFKKYEREDGLIFSVTEKWNLVDWPDNLRDGYDVLIERPMNDICHNVINAFYIGALKCSNEIFKAFNMPEINTAYYDSAFIKEFYKEDIQLYGDCAKSNHSSLHSNVLPLLFNVGVNEGFKKNAINLIKKKGLSSCGTYFSYFVLQALKNSGENQLIIDLIKDEKVWLNMLSEGATTTYEAWGKDQKKNTSLFHPWSTCPIIILYDIN